MTVRRLTVLCQLHVNMLVLTSSILEFDKTDIVHLCVYGVCAMLVNLLLTT